MLRSTSLALVGRQDCHFRLAGTADRTAMAALASKAFSVGTA